MTSSDYHLYRKLSGHCGAVRCLSSLPDGTLVSGGLDGQIRIWLSLPQTVQCKDFIYSVASSFDGEFVAAGSKDKNIYIVQVSTGSVVKVLTGHTGPVSAVLFISPEVLVSGSWDGSMRLWSVSTGSELHHIPDAGAYAICVARISDQLLVSGSQSKEIKLWRVQSGEAACSLTLEETIVGAHEDIIRGISVDLGTGNFWSCSNDSLVKCWGVTPVSAAGTFSSGSAGFVFGLGLLPGAFVTACDDGTVNVISAETGEVVQTVKHGKTVWGVAVQHRRDAGTSPLIASACADGVVRVFSTDPGEIATQAEIEEFERLAAGTAAGATGEQLPDIRSLPTVAQIATVAGKKTGEVKMFTDGRDIFAYQWDGRDWALLGTVTGAGAPAPGAGAAPGSGPGTGAASGPAAGGVHYPGDAIFPAGVYDYVFDVEVGSATRRAKLPVNRGENKLVVAENFCAREDLDRTQNAADIVAFLDANVASGSAAAQSRLQPHVDPEPERHLQPVRFSEVNWGGLKKKLAEEGLVSEDSELFRKLGTSQLSCVTGSGGAALSGPEVEALTKALVPAARRSFVVLDLWRMLLVADAGPGGAVATELRRPIYTAKVLEAVESGQAAAGGAGLGFALCGVKFLANLTATGVGRVGVVQGEKLLEVLEGVLAGRVLEKSKTGVLSLIGLLGNLVLGQELRSIRGRVGQFLDKHKAYLAEQGGDEGQKILNNILRSL